MYKFAEISLSQILATRAPDHRIALLSGAGYPGRKKQDLCSQKEDSGLPDAGLSDLSRLRPFADRQFVDGPIKEVLYYHCKRPCKARFHTYKTHELFSQELKKFVPRPGMIEVYKEVIHSHYQSQTKGQREDLKAIKGELEQLNTRLVKARNLLIDDQLDVADYKAVKEECEKKITQLEATLFAAGSGDTDIEALLSRALETLAHLEQLWEEATTERKRLIIGSIFPEKLVFDGNHFQTARLNEGARLIYTLNAGFSENKNGQREKNSPLSSMVTLSGLVSLRSMIHYTWPYPKPPSPLSRPAAFLFVRYGE